MPSVFVSYARANDPQATQVADALRSAGFQVWRDDQLPAHRSYSDVIQERLETADAVVVLWSAESAKSDWVRSEADAARARGTLIQATLDGSKPPMPFEQIHCAILTDWDGSKEEPQWLKLHESVLALTGVEENEEEAPAFATTLSIIVLPFTNMSGDAEQEYFSDGISEDITTDLSKISSLEVIARNTAFAFKGKSPDVAELARKFGVSHVLEGSVRKSGNRVRITAQLIDGRRGGHIWAERYDRDLTDIFEIQDEISEAIVDALKIKLLPTERMQIEDRGTSDAAAYDLYLLARQIWITGNHGDRRREERVIQICEQAVRLDPDYPEAWALMAIAQSNLRYGLGDLAADDGVAAANRALSLRSTMAEAYCPIARKDAESGRIAEAEEALDLAIRLDPDSWEVNKEAARFYFHQRRIPEAKRHFEKSTELMEHDFHAWALLFSCYNAEGNTAGLRRAAKMVASQAEKALADDPTNGAALSIGATGLAYLGETSRANDWINRALLINPDNLNLRYNYACFAAASVGDVDQAIEMLEAVLLKAGPSIVSLAKSDPDLDRLRGDVRFQRMLTAAFDRLGIREDP